MPRQPHADAAFALTHNLTHATKSAHGRSGEVRFG